MKEIQLQEFQMQWISIF